MSGCEAEDAPEGAPRRSLEAGPENDAAIWEKAVYLWTTVRPIAAVWTMLPDFPVTDTWLVPILAELLSVNVIELDVEVGFGEIDAVTPLGSPETDRVTAPVNPYIAFTEIVLLPLAPCLIDRLDGEAVRV